MIATTKELRFHSKKLLDSTSRGEEVLITYRGKAVAKLVPVKQSKISKKNEDELFGIWSDNKNVSDVNEYVRELRKGRFDADR